MPEIYTMLDRYKKLLRSIFQKMKLNLLTNKVNFIPLDELPYQEVIIEGNGNEVCYSPIYNNEEPFSDLYNNVDIKLYELNNVYANINSSSFLNTDKNTAYIETFPYLKNDKANYASGHLLAHDDHVAYFKITKVKSVNRFDRLLFLGGNGSFNFYHWLVEIAPKLLCLNNELLLKYKISTIVVNDKVRDIENYQWILQQCLSHLTDIKVLYSNQDESLYAEKLYFINTFNQTVFNYSKPKKIPSISTIYNKRIINTLSERLISANLIKIEEELPSKIFILRNDQAVSSFNKRSYNQNEIFDYFKEQGFIGIYPDKLSISEQITIFKNANFIVGPSGSGWANLIFAQPGTRAISWLPKSAQFFDTYSMLAAILEINIRFTVYSTQINDDIHSSYKLSVSTLRALYESMLVDLQ